MKKYFRVMALLLVIFLVLVLTVGCPPLPQQRPTAPETNQPPPGAQPERNVEQPPIHQQIPDNELAMRVAELARNVDGVAEASVVVVGTTAFIGVKLEGAGNQEAVKQQVEEQVERETIIVEALVSDDPDIIREIDNIRTGAIPPNAIGGLYDRMQAERR